MSEPFLVLINFFLVSLGAILGTSLRLSIINIFESIFNKSFLGVFTVNNIATFLFGILLGLLNRYQFNLSSNPFSLLLGIGFLGSLSTFSSFVMELLEFLIDKKWKQFFIFSSFSITSGILVAFIGYQLSNG